MVYVLVLACANGAKSLACSSRVMPTPVSMTRMTSVRRVVSRPAATFGSTVATTCTRRSGTRRVNLMALERRFTRICEIRWLSPWMWARGLWGT